MEVDNYNTINAVIYNEKTYSQVQTSSTNEKKQEPVADKDILEIDNKNVSTHPTKSNPTKSSKEPAKSQNALQRANKERNQDRNPDDSISKAIQEANKRIMGTDRYLSYSVHQGTKDIMIKIIDANTKEIIKEIPPEKNLDAIAKMWELVGIIVDKKM